MQIETVDFGNKIAYFIPKDKEVSSIEYVDGTCDIFVELPNDVMHLVYGVAAEKNITAEEALSELVQEGIKHLTDKLGAEEPKCKCKKKGSKCK